MDEFRKWQFLLTIYQYINNAYVGGWVRKSPKHAYIIYEWSSSLRPTRSSEANEPNGGRAVIACSLPFGHFGHTGLSDLLVHQNPKGGKKGHLQLLQVQETTCYCCERKSFRQQEKIEINRLHT